MTAAVVRYVQHDNNTRRLLLAALGPLKSLHEQDLKKRATDLVRLALFQEQRRMPLRRDDISKKVIGSQRGAFKAVFEEAQKILRATFGMELVELPTRAATHDTAGGATGKDKTQEKAATQNGDGGAGDRQAVTGLKKKGAVLRSPRSLFPAF